MGFCSIHWKSYEGHCESCQRLYNEDMAAIPPRIPPQFLAAGVKFEFEDWREIREAEAKAEGEAISTREYQQATTDAERAAAVEKISRKRAADAIDACLTSHRMQQAAKSRSPAQMTAEQDAKIRGRALLSSVKTI